MKIKITINDELEELQVNQRLDYLKINNLNNNVTKYPKYGYLNIFENSFTVMNFLENSND